MVTDYLYGEKQLTQLQQFFSALGRPAEFEAPVQAVYRSYEKAKTLIPGDKLLQWQKATQMKQVGADASRLMAEIQARYPSRAAAVPSGARSDVYDPEKPSWFPKLTIPWWAWAIGGVAAVALFTPWLAPITGRLLSRARS